MKKNYFVSIFVLLISVTALGAKYFDDIRVDSIGVGTMSPSSATVLDVVSTAKASRPCPVMTTSQRDAIVSPALGSCIFNFDDDILNYYNGSAWGAISQPGTILGPVSSTDNAIVRFDGVSGTQTQNSLVTISDTGVIAGGTQIDLGNLRLTGSTLSSTNTNGAINLEPNGTGQVVSTKTIKGGVLESTGDLLIAGPWQGVATTDSSTTGTDATLANPASLVISLTNASLQSISHITSGVSRFAIVTNKTGNIITIKESGSGTAANRIITGTGGDIEIENGGSFLISYIAGSVNRWHVVGGTGTGGGGPPPQQFTQKNDYNFESTVGNWVRYNDGNTAAPVDCTGGTPSGDFTFSRETSVPLVGRGSGFINAANLANTRGEGVSVTVPISTVYQNRPLYLEFDYYGFANYANDDFKVFVYDVTNGALLNGGQPYTQSSISSSYGKFYANVTPGANSSNLRICIHNTTTATTLKALHFDEVRLKLSEGFDLPLITSWTPVTLALNSNTGVASQQFWTKIVGQDRWIRGSIQYSGAGANSTLTITLPNGETIDNSVSVGSSVNDIFNFAQWYDDVGGLSNTFSVVRAGGSSISFRRGNELNSSTFASGDRFTVFAIIPITQLSRNNIQGLASQANLQYESKSATTTSSQTDYSPLRLTNLKIGSRYEIILSMFPEAGSSATSTFDAINNSINVASVTGVAVSVDVRPTSSKAFIFTAQSSTLSFNITKNTAVSTVFQYTLKEVPFSNTAIMAVPDAELFVDTGNGQGSTNTTVRRFTNIRKNSLGSFATYADSATLGASVTVNIKGSYMVTYSDFSSGSTGVAITVNSTALTTNPFSITYANGKRAITQASAGEVGSVSRVLTLSPGDIIRAQCGAGASGNNDNIIFSVKFLGWVN